MLYQDFIQTLHTQARLCAFIKDATTHPHTIAKVTATHLSYQKPNVAVESLLQYAPELPVLLRSLQADTLKTFYLTYQKARAQFTRRLTDTAASHSTSLKEHLEIASRLSARIATSPQSISSLYYPYVAPTKSSFSLTTLQEHLIHYTVLCTRSTELLTNLLKETTPVAALTSYLLEARATPELTPHLTRIQSLYTRIYPVNEYGVYPLSDNAALRVKTIPIEKDVSLLNPTLKYLPTHSVCYRSDRVSSARTILPYLTQYTEAFSRYRAQLSAIEPLIASIGRYLDTLVGYPRVEPDKALEEALCRSMTLYLIYLTQILTYATFSADELLEYLTTRVDAILYAHRTYLKCS